MLTGSDFGLSVFTAMRISFPFSYSYSCIQRKTRASFLVLLFLFMGLCQCSQLNLRHKCNGLTLAQLESHIFMRIKEKRCVNSESPRPILFQLIALLSSNIPHTWNFHYISFWMRIEEFVATLGIWGNWGALNGPYLVLVVLWGILFMGMS